MPQAYQPTKSKDYGVNTCESCLQKQLKIDRLEQEVASLRGELQRLKRKSVEGFFSSSTPSSKLPVKETSSQENIKKQGGAKPGHPGHGRSSHSPEEAEEVRTIRVQDTNCPQCDAPLWQKGAVNRSVLEVEVMRVKKLLYRLQRKYCPDCQTYLQAKVSSLLPNMLLSNEF